MFTLATMKISWLRRMNVVESGFKTCILNIYPDLSNVTAFGSEYIIYCHRESRHPFWRDVLKHLKNLYTRSTPQSVDEFMSECIHYNANILGDQRVLYIKNGLIMV